MAAIDLNLNPSKRQLGQFGLIGLFALPAIGWMLSGKPTPATLETANLQVLTGFAVSGLLMGVLTMARPEWLKWLFIGASLVTFPIGFVLGEVVMFLVFSVTFVPMALLFRLIKRDALHRSIQRDLPTYWQRKAQPQGVASYYRQS